MIISQRKRPIPCSVSVPLDLVDWVDSISKNRSAIFVKALMEYRNRNDNFDSKLKELEASRSMKLGELDFIDQEIKLVKSVRIEDDARDNVVESENIEDLKRKLGRSNN